MKAGSMEGLIGANANIGIARTPLRVYKEAERKGDTATMERSMGYFTELSQKAVRDTEKAAEETLKEQKEERREREIEREQAIEEKRAETKAARESALETAETNAAEKTEVDPIGEGAIGEGTPTSEPTPEVVPLVYTDTGAARAVAEPTVVLDVKG
ncbi:MAG: hypothetical protein NC237_04015 [Eubacterium sp.]|nr:hypothetical protein [Eubacterium sp.]